MEIIVENPNHVRDAEIIVGIPPYNEADSISYPTDKANRGLVDFFPDKKFKDIHIYTIRGKGNNLRNLFEASVALRAKALVLVDADLKSITPQYFERINRVFENEKHYLIKRWDEDPNKLVYKLFND